MLTYRGAAARTKIVGATRYLAACNRSSGQG